MRKSIGILSVALLALLGAYLAVVAREIHRQSTIEEARPIAEKAAYQGQCDSCWALGRWLMKLIDIATRRGEEIKEWERADERCFRIIGGLVARAEKAESERDYFREIARKALDADVAAARR